MTNHTLHPGSTSLFEYDSIDEAVFEVSAQAVENVMIAQVGHMARKLAEILEHDPVNREELIRTYLLRQRIKIDTQGLTRRYEKTIMAKNVKDALRYWGFQNLRGCVEPQVEMRTKFWSHRVVFIITFT